VWGLDNHSHFWVLDYLEMGIQQGKIDRLRQRWRLDTAAVEQARRQRALLRGELATAAGVSRSALYKALRSGECGLRVARSIARALDLQVGELLIPWIK